MRSMVPEGVRVTDWQQQRKKALARQRAREPGGFWGMESGWAGRRVRMTESDAI